MSEKYDYIMTSTGETFRMRNGEIYDAHKNYLKKYKSIIDYSSSLFTSSTHPSDFFDMEVKEYIDKILNSKISREDYKTLLKEYQLLRKSTELQIVLVKDENTPKNIIEEIVKMQNEYVKPHLLQRDDLSEPMLRVIFNGFEMNIFSIFDSYINKQSELPISQKAVEYAIKHFTSRMDHRPLAHCKNKELILNILENAKTNKSLISTMIASNTHMDDKIRNEVFFNIENDCDIFGVQNPTDKMCEERYESLVSTLDVENENNDPEIEKSLALSLNHLVSALENKHLSFSMQQDLFYRISEKDWQDDKYSNIVNALCRYGEAPGMLYDLCVAFIDKTPDDRLNPIYSNKNLSPNTLQYLLNYHAYKANTLKDSPKQKQHINKIKELLPHIKPTGIICDNLLRIESQSINLALISHSQIGISINKFSETKNPEEKFFYEIVKDRTLSNVAKKSLFKTFSNPKENIVFYQSAYGEDKPKSVFGVDIDMTGLLQSDVDNIKDFLNIHKGLTESKKFSQMMINYLEKIDIDFEKYNTLRNLGITEKEDDTKFINENNPKILEMNTNEMKESLNHLSKCVIENIKDLFGEKFLSLKTKEDCIRFYKEIDNYNRIFEVLQEKLKEKEINFEEFSFNTR